MVESNLVSALIPEAVNLARSQSPLFRLEDSRASGGSRTRSERVPFCLLGACLKDKTIVPF